MDTFGGFLPLTACQGCEQASDASRIFSALIESALADSPHFRHTNFAWVCGCLPIPDRILPMLPGRCGGPCPSQNSVQLQDVSRARILSTVAVSDTIDHQREECEF